MESKVQEKSMVASNLKIIVKNVNREEDSSFILVATLVQTHT